MESCKAESLTRGWTYEEDTLLFSTAERAYNEGRALRSAFEAVAVQTGRKPNSVRNYYYARVKRGDTQGIPCRCAAFVPFGNDEVHELIRTVLTQRAKGVSVRACTLNMGNGDTRAMLRYQNKYRSVVKNDPALVKGIMAELESEGIAAFDPYEKRPSSRMGRLSRADAISFFTALEELAASYRQMLQ